MRITRNIHAIKIPFQIKLPTGTVLDRFVYVYLIYGDKIYLIDSGVASGENIIFDHIKRTGREPDDISLIVLTHSHPDHIGAASGIKEKTGCKVAAHPAEKNWIEDVGLQARQRPVPGFQSLVKGSVRVDSMLNDGDILKIENDISLEVLHTPGHSKGSVSLLFREDMALFSGDSVFIPGDIPIYEDVSAAVNSMNKLKSIAGLKFLLSSWDDPKQEGEIYKTMDQGLDYLQQIHNVITEIKNREPGKEPMKLCREVISELGLPAAALNPLVAGSFRSNLKVAGKSLL